MADYSTTISNSLYVFGPAPSNKWNAYNWNAFRWGEGNTPLVKVDLKVLSESLTLTDSVSKVPSRVIENTLSPTTAMSLESLTDAEGYYRVFPGGVTDAVDRAIPSWSQGSAGSTTWASSSTTATTWSAA